MINEFSSRCAKSKSWCCFCKRRWMQKLLLLLLLLLFWFGGIIFLACLSATLSLFMIFYYCCSSSLSIHLLLYFLCSELLKALNSTWTLYAARICETTEKEIWTELQEIRHLCSYLQDLKKASAEEMRRSVYANYAAFIRCGSFFFCKISCFAIVTSVSYVNLPL